MKRQSSILSCFSQLSAKRREIGIDGELGSISRGKEQEPVPGCNEDPGATNKTLSPELVEVSLSIHSGASLLEHLDLQTEYMYYLTPIEQPTHVFCRHSRHVALRLE